MKSLDWVRINWIVGLIDWWGLHFRTGIVLETIPSVFLVFYIRVPGQSWNGSGVRPYPRVQKKFVLFRQSTQNEWFSPADFLGQFFSDSAFNLLRNMCDVLLVNSRNARVPWLAVPRMLLLCISWNGCQFPIVSQICHLWKGKTLNSSDDWISFICWSNGEFYKKVINNLSQSAKLTDSQKNIRDPKY